MMCDVLGKYWEMQKMIKILEIKITQVTTLWVKREFNRMMCDVLGKYWEMQKMIKILKIKLLKLRLYEWNESLKKK